MEARIQFQARIEVASAGYEWSNAGARAILMYRDAPGRDGDQAKMPPESFRWYDPFRDEPALFQAFADLDALPWPPDYSKQGDVTRLRASILEFADNYGAPYLSGQFDIGFNLEILQMRAAIELWEAGRQRDKDSIAKYINWNKRLGWNLLQTPLAGIEPTDGWSDAPRGKDRGLRQAAELVDAIIAQKCSYDLRVTPVRGTDGTVTLAVEVDELVTALWLQFAFAVAENKEYRRCEVCNRAFELSPGENRADRRSCSDKCRVRGYRRRKAQAATMRAAGAHLRKIAKHLDTDLATVKRWVGES